MKEIKAIIQPFRKEAVIEALRAIEGLPGAVCSPCHAHSVHASDWSEEAKVKVEIMVPDELAEQVVSAIQQAACTGHPGDGRIHVLPIEDSIVIRTGEHTKEPG
ncbi:MAG: P-II family nitrogen regulator [Nitrospira sp.]|nr:P-II family nitrogen regulator [Nitrospira sp.]